MFVDDVGQALAFREATRSPGREIRQCFAGKSPTCSLGYPAPPDQEAGAGAHDIAGHRIRAARGGELEHVRLAGCLGRPELIRGHH